MILALRFSLAALAAAALLADVASAGPPLRLVPLDGRPTAAARPEPPASRAAPPRGGAPAAPTVQQRPTRPPAR